MPKLLVREKNILIKSGATKEDIMEIEKSTIKLVITSVNNPNNVKRIGHEKAKQMLGVDYLYGLNRACFHRTTVRETPNKEYIIGFERTDW